MTTLMAALLMLSVTMVAWGVWGLVSRPHGVFRGKSTFHSGEDLIRVLSIAAGVVLGVMILNGSLQGMLMGIGGSMTTAAKTGGGPGGTTSGGTGLGLATQLTPTGFWNTPLVGPLVKWLLTTFAVPVLGALAVVMVVYGIFSLGLHAIAALPRRRA